MAKRGPKPKQVDIDKVEELSGDGFTKEQIAEILGMHPATFYERQAENPEIAEAYKRGKTGLHQFAVRSLKSKMQDGDTTAIIFACKSWAGMKDRIDHTNNGGSFEPDTVGTKNVWLTGVKMPDA